MTFPPDTSRPLPDQGSLAPAATTAPATPTAAWADRVAAWLERPWVAPLLILLAVALVHGRAVGFAFTNWDDDVALVDNTLLRHANWANLLAIWTPGGVTHEMLYIPVVYSSHLLEVGLVGLRPWLVHLDNVLLHALCALGVYAIVRARLERRLALAAALIFALHPLQVEAVAWATGRKDLLAGLFAIGAILAWQRWLEQRLPSAWMLAFTCCTLALLSKPSAVAIPPMLFGYAAYTILSRLGRRAFANVRRDWGAVLLGLAPFCLLAVADYAINHQLAGTPPPNAPPMLWRVVAIPWVLWGWLNRVVLIRHPQPIYAWPATADHAAMLGAAACLLLLAILAGVIAWRQIRRDEAPWLLCLGGLTLLAFAPALAIVLGYRDFITADRYAYLAFIPFAELVVVALWRGWRDPLAPLLNASATPSSFGSPTAAPASGTTDPAALGTRDRWKGMILATLIGVLGLYSAVQVGVWRDSVTLWTTVLQAYPNDASAHNSLGRVYADRGDRLLARHEFRIAVDLAPDHWRAWNNLGALLLDLDTSGESHELPAAVEALNRAIELNPGYFAARFNLGQVHLREATPAGYAAAAEAFRSAIELNPTSLLAVMGLGETFRQLGQPTNATACYRKALELDADYVPAQEALKALGVSPEPLLRLQPPPPPTP